MKDYIKSLKDVKVRVIVDKRYDDVDETIDNLNLPITCMSIASVLNNKEIYEYEQNKENDYLLFEAPEANILIVDDNVTNLTVAEGLLEPINMKIKTATSGEEAIMLVKKKVITFPVQLIKMICQKLLTCFLEMKWLLWVVLMI